MPPTLTASRSPFWTAARVTETIARARQLIAAVAPVQTVHQQQPPDSAAATDQATHPCPCCGGRMNTCAGKPSKEQAARPRVQLWVLRGARWSFFAIQSSASALASKCPDDAPVRKVERDQLWDVLRGGAWCRARVVNAVRPREPSFLHGARRGKRERRDGHAGRNEEFREVSVCRQRC
jgi:hypothetical protein